MQESPPAGPASPPANAPTGQHAVLVSLRVAVSVPPGTVIGTAHDGTGARLLLPDGRVLSPVLGFEATDAQGSGFETVATDPALQRFGVSVDDYVESEVEAEDPAAVPLDTEGAEA